MMRRMAREAERGNEVRPTANSDWELGVGFAMGMGDMDGDWLLHGAILTPDRDPHRESESRIPIRNHTPNRFLPLTPQRRQDIFQDCPGQVAEWLKAPVSKTGEPATVP